MSSTFKCLMERPGRCVIFFISKSSKRCVAKKKVARLRVSVSMVLATMRVADVLSVEAQNSSAKTILCGVTLLRIVFACCISHVKDECPSMRLSPFPMRKKS